MKPGLTARRVAVAAVCVLLLASHSGVALSGIIGPPPVRISIGDARVLEGNSGTTSLVFPLAPLAPFCKPITVHYQTVDGTAKAGEDYVTTSGDTTIHSLPPVFRLKWGATGSGNGQFRDPGGIALTASGQVLVADQINDRIQRFDANGNYISQFGVAGSGNGQFSNPVGVAVDPNNGNIYVADYGNHRVEKFNSSGAFLSEITGDPSSAGGHFNHPYAVAVDLNGSLFVAELDGHRIQKFDANGNFLTKWGTQGGGTGQFRGPTGVAVDFNGVVYVADGSNERIQRFTNGGIFIATWGDSGTADGQFQYVSGIAVDADGCVFAADSANDRVQKFDSGGSFIAKWGSNGGGDGQFTDAGPGVAVDPSGNVYVSDASANRVQKFRPVIPSGTLTVLVQGDTRFEPNEEFTLVLSTPQNAILQKGVGHGLIANDDLVRVLVHDASVTEGDAATTPLDFSVNLSGPNSRTVSLHYQTEDGTATVANNDYAAASGDLTIAPAPPSFLLEWGSNGTGNGQFVDPAHVAVDGSGNVFVADFGNNRIQKFDADGNFVTTWGSFGTGDGQFKSPAGVAVDAFGNVYVADYTNNRIQVFDGNGTFITKWGTGGTGSGQFNGPAGVAVDAGGNVYVADRVNHRVQRFDASGTFLSQLGTTGVTGTGNGVFNQPFAVAVDVSGNLYVVEFANHRVQKFNSSGVFQTKWGRSGGDGTFGFGDGEFQNPQAIATDASGNVYVADTNNNRVQKFAGDGTFIVKWGTTGTGVGEFQGPRGVAVEGGDHVYVVDISNRRVQKFEPVADSAQFSVTVNGDTHVEPEEVVRVVLSSVVNATLPRALAHGIIHNDDVLVAIHDGRVGEGNSGTAHLEFVVSVDGAICQPVGVHYESLDGTATTANNDFVAASDDLLMTPGGAPAFQLAWGTNGPGNGQFNEPADVAIDGSGNIYFADRYNHRVQKFGPNGNYLTQLGTGVAGSADGQFNEPFGVAVRGGYVYVADAVNNRIQKFAENGTFVGKWGTPGTGAGQFNGPFGVAVAGNGDVYVADRFNNRIQKFDANGNFLLKWGANGGDGSSGNGDGDFSHPTGVFVDDDDFVYVADFLNDRYQKFDATGGFVDKRGGSGAGDGQFNRPFKVAVDGCGDVYVADRGNNRIQKFGADGAFITKWGTNGSAVGEFNGADAVAIDGGGGVYVADEQNHRIQKFRRVDPFDVIKVVVQGDTQFEPNENLQVRLTSPVNARLARDLATGLILNDDAEIRAGDDRVVEGNSLTTDLEFRLSLQGPVCRSVTLHYQTMDGTATTADNDYLARSGDLTIDPLPPTFEHKWGSFGTDTGQFKGPVGVALDGNGNVYVGDYGNNRIQKFDASGNFRAQWGSSGTGDGQFNRPLGVAVDGSGDVYVAEEAGDRVQKFDANGVFLTKWGSTGSGDGQFNRPEGLAVDVNGFVYVADYSNNRVQKFDSNGRFLRKWGSFGTGDGELDQPYGVAVDANGNAYVVELGNQRIQKFDANGNFLTKWSLRESGQEVPVLATFDACGNLYVTDAGTHRVRVFDQDGAFLTGWGSAGSGDGQFLGAYGIAVDDSGHVYVADYGNNRVQKFAPVTPSDTIPVPANGDIKYEPNETLKLVLSSVVNATAAKDTAYGLIVNDDPVEVSIADAGRLEGNTGIALLKFAVSLSGAICDSVKMHYQTQDGTATTADNDYVSAAGDLKIAPLPPAFERKWGSSSPLGVAADASGHVYVTNYFGYRVEKYDADGNLLLTWGSQGTDDGQFNGPYGLAVDGSGYVYVTDQLNQNIQKFGSDGTFILKWGTQGQGDGEFSNPQAIAVDENGNVHVADFTNGRIQKFDPYGKYLAQYGGIGGPDGVAADGRGHLYVTAIQENRVLKFDTNGNFITAWSGSPGAPFLQPLGVAVDTRGNVYVGEYGNHRVQKFDSTGTFVTKWGKNGGDGTFGNGDGQFREPYGLATDGGDHVYVADFANQRIQKFAPVTPQDTIPMTVNGDKKVEPDEAFSVRLTAPVNATFADSVATGTILNDDIAPSVHVIFPNGGEAFPVNSHQNIQWTATDDGTITSVDIAYSTDGGATFPFVIATGIPNSSPYDWTVPNTLTNTARVRVIGYDNDGNSGRDSSDANFSIIEPNLACNPGFEPPKNLTGWAKVGSCVLSQVSPGRSGTYAMQIRSTSDSKFGIDDSPNCINPATLAIYQFSAYVRSATGDRGDVTIEIREYVGSTLKGSVSSVKVQPSSSWQLVTVDYKVRTAGSSLSFQILDDPDHDDEVFLVDDVTILRLPDRPPVVTAPTIVNGSVGNPIGFTVTASDPDGHTITSFSHTGPAGSTFSTNSNKTSGAFSWTPSATGTYFAYFAATANSLTGRDTTQINVSLAPPNLCRNGDFETGDWGWDPYGSAQLKQVAGGRTSPFALQIKGSGSSSFGCDDSLPNWVDHAAGRGAVYKFSAYMRSVSHTGKVKFRIYEFLGSSQQGSTFYSPEVTLSTAWKPITVNYTVRTNGTTLSMRITDDSGGQTFLVDDVSITLVSGPTIVAVAGNELEAGDEADVPPPVADTRRAFADAAGALRLDGESDAWGARLESLPQEMETEMPSVVLKYGGREIQALPERTLLGEDQDANGREEMAAWFDPAALQSLFAGLPAGSRQVEAVLEARSSGSRVASAPLTFEAQGLRLVYSASFAPNPARSTGVFSFTLTRAGWVRAHVFDASGRRVQTLVDETAVEAGSHRIRLDGTGRRRLPSGLYFYWIESQEGVLGGRFVFMN